MPFLPHALHVLCVICCLLRTMVTSGISGSPSDGPSVSREVEKSLERMSLSDTLQFHRDFWILFCEYRAVTVYFRVNSSRKS